jgi:RNA polymerase sigma factor (sigma-70 family)
VRLMGMDPDHALARVKGVELELVVQDTLEGVFRREYARLVRAAWLVSGSREVGEDIVQDVFARMLASGSVPSEPAHYVYRSVVNGVRSWQRRQVLERRHALVEPAGVQATPELYWFSDYLCTLSPRQRTAIVLRYYCDLPLAEVAVLMGCRVGTVTVLIRRALGKARKMKEAFES